MASNDDYSSDDQVEEDKAQFYIPYARIRRVVAPAEPSKPTGQNAGAASPTRHRSGKPKKGGPIQVTDESQDRNVSTSSGTPRSNLSTSGSRSGGKLSTSATPSRMVPLTPAHGPQQPDALQARQHTRQTRSHVQETESFSDSDDANSDRNRKHAMALSGSKKDVKMTPRKRGAAAAGDDPKAKIRRTYYARDGSCRWPHERPTVDMMVEANLKFVGIPEPDLAECVGCRGLLHTFDPEDVPVEEHRRFFPECRYSK